jgi:putative ABC transport system substrate-binding protein
LADKALEWQGTQMAARALGATPYSVEMRGPDDFDGAFATLVRERPDALIMSAETLTPVHHRQIVEFAIQHRLAMIAEAKDFAAAGLS